MLACPQRSSGAPRHGATRPGFTLLELLLAVSVMLVVFGIAIPFFRKQIETMTAHAGRFDAQQNARFGGATVDRELRIAGSGVPATQPMIVQADPYAITFNADLAARDTASEGGAFGAVYYDPDLPAGSTMSLTPSQAITLPRSTVTYPSTTYYNGNGPQSSAETISFWVAPDSTAGSNGRYALYRRVNNLPASVVARGLVVRANDPPPFTYYVFDPNTAAPIALNPNTLPVFHVAQHGSAADTGKSAVTDGIRTVHVFLRGVFIGARRDTSQRVVETDIRLVNSGLLKLPTCGDAPIFGQPVKVAPPPPGQTYVTISWNPATDENAGEKDVERYTIWRRVPPATAFGEPIASIPAGQSSYKFTDSPGSGTYVYGVAAQDCGGQFSSVVVSNQVKVP